MSENRIDIEVNVDSKEAEKGLKRLEGTSEAVGESFNVVGESISKMGGEVNENLGLIGESVGGLVGSFSDLTTATKESGASFTGLLGPIGAVAIGVIELVKAFQEYSGAAKESEIRIEAYKAATAEMTSIIEELAAAQVKLNHEQIKELQTLSMKAKIPLETAQMIRDSNAERQEEITLIDESVKSLRKRHEENKKQARFQVSAGEALEVNRLLSKREKILKKIQEQEKIAIELTYKGQQAFSLLEKEKQRYLETSIEFRESVLKKELELVEQAQLQVLAAEADTLEGQKKLLDAQVKIRLKNLEKMFQEGKISRESGYKIIEGIEAQHQSNLRKAEEADRQKRLAKYRTFQAKKLAELRKTQAEEARIRQLEIERLRIQGATEIEVLEQRYQEELRLAGKNQNLQLIAQMKFENKRLEMDQAATKKAEEEAQKAAREEQERAKQRQAFILDNLEFDLNQQRDSIGKELDLLNLRYEREFRLRELNESEITELVRRQAIERQAILERSTNEALDKIEDLFAGAATSATAQAFSNILDRQVEFQLRDLDARHKHDIQKIRESNQEAVEIDKQLTETMQSYAQQREQIRKQEAAMIPKLISQTLAGLAKEAGVEALMNFARAAASLFVDPAASAGYAKAGALMSAAAITAGYASYQVAGSAYVPPMMNTGGGATSPTGSPQTATPERQRAETTATVYNINFGNSVIYDTRRAAQDAFADQIIQTMNRRRRGSPEFRRF